MHKTSSYGRLLLIKRLHTVGRNLGFLKQNILIGILVQIISFSLHHGPRRTAPEVASPEVAPEPLTPSTEAGSDIATSRERLPNGGTSRIQPLPQSLCFFHPEPAERCSLSAGLNPESQPTSCTVHKMPDCMANIIQLKHTYGIWYQRV